MRILTAAALVFAASPVRALDRVSLRREGALAHVTGKVLVEAEDGGLMLLDRQGAIWIVQPNELVRRDQDGAPFEPVGRDELAGKLKAEMPAGSKTYSTAHFLICHNTTKAYAQWCGSLYERLYRGFYAYWSRLGFELHDPQFPLVAMVFDSKGSYAKYAEKDLGKSTATAISFGYYSLTTNRVTTYDLTGVEGQGLAPKRISSAALVNRILSQPGAERNVATMVHEATHQLAFNSGLYARFADIPLWVSEGVAIFFETPDLASSKGWRTIGAVNRIRLQQFRRYCASRPGGSLRSLLADHQRFRQVQTAADAYAEAWALNYYLLRARSKEYGKYLQVLAKKAPLAEDRPEDRIAQFEAAFGEDLKEVDERFLRFMAGVR